MDNCEPFRTARMQEGHHDYVRIATPEVGDELSVRTTRGVRGLVCRPRDIIACLESGDVVRLTWPTAQWNIWKKDLGLLKPSSLATCRNDCEVRNSFVLAESGRIINFSGQALNKGMTIQVISLVPRDPYYAHTHGQPEVAVAESALPIPFDVEPEYAGDLDFVRQLVRSASLPPPLPVSAQLVEEECLAHA
jgi:hypothetical protein